MGARRRPPLAARMADVLDRAAWALEVLVEAVPRVERRSGQPTYPCSTREALQPSAERLAGEARALVAEYQRRRR